MLKMMNTHGKMFNPSAKAEGGEQATNQL